MKKFIAFIFAALFAAVAWAHQYEARVDGVIWYYNRISNGKGGYNAEITYRGSSYSSCSDEYSGALTIPSKLGGYSVTTIGEGAFYNCSWLTSVTIPDGVTTIGERAFEDCSSLTSVTIGNGVTTIGDDAFFICRSLTTITIPNSVTTIGEGAFYDCSSLASVTIPNSVTTIGLSAFYGTPFYNNQPDGLVILGNGCLYRYKGTCPSSVTIPDSVTTIGECAFYNCSSLTSITIPDGVTTIGDYAFFICRSLTTITIPNSVTTIGEGAFDECSSLASVTIPNSVTTIGSRAFDGCSSLKSFIVGEYNPNYKSINGLLCSKEGKTIVFGVNGDVTIPDGVTEIGDRAFSGCSSLTSITIPDSVTTIGDWAFRYCSSLTSVTIPNSVRSIGYDAFSDCSSLTSVTIPACVEKLSTTFADIYENIEEVAFAEGVRTIRSFMFSGCNSLTSVTIPESVTEIEFNTFRGCSSLKEIVGWRMGCPTDLERIVTSSSVTTIEDSAFRDCRSLVSVTMLNSVTTIGSRAFEYCSSLASVTIPNSVTTIGEYAFRGCSSLTSVTIPNSVTTIGDTSFYNCSSLTSITIPEGVTTIGSFAFENCSSLTSITIPNSVTTIGGYAFYGCKSLTSVTISSSVTTIETSAFSDCSSLTSVTIPDGVTSIGESAFSGCSSLTSVTIPDSVTSIGSSAFIGCRMLGVVYTNVESSIKSLMRSSGFDVNSILFVVPQAPIITPLDGAILSDSSTVVIKSELEGSTIYYTIDGSRPTCQSNEYTRKFRIDKKCTIRAIIAINGIQSDEIIARYAFGQCPNPEIVIQGEEEFLHIGRVVTINYDCDEGIVCYTIDGSEPTADSPIYDGPIVIDDTTTIRAKAFSDRYFDSDVVELTLVREWEQLPKVEIVGMDDFVGETSVSITCEDRSAAIYYTLDGSEPTTGSMCYTTPFVITEGKTIKAVAVRDDYLNSEVVTRVVRQSQVASPVISAADSFQGSKTIVSIECIDDGVIHYTLDGTIPTSASLVYSEPFEVTATTVVKAYAKKDGYVDSALSSKTIIKTWCIGDTMGEPDRVFTTEGTLGWVDDNDVAMRSGKIADNQESKLRTVVVGGGSLSFDWKVSCEDSGGLYDYDRLELHIDGARVRVIDGITDWQFVEIVIDAEGDHTIEWIYIKDGDEFDGEDCAWVRKFVWEKSNRRPEAIENASDDVKEVFDKWIADNDVADPSAANVNAFILGLEPSATEEAIQEKVEEELANLDLGKLVEGDISAAVAEIQAKYPNAKVDLAPVDDINTSAHLYKLVIKLK